ncbi:MAG: sulfite exporter TauE/SafE family protein [Bdellovibrionales bacterium]|nr:sulfite exporter TauE/SafE family protein [Bdellovibrionales bacterium]
MAADWIPFGVALASFFGSAHCAMMCGPLTLLLGQNRRAHVAWHAGRLAAYISLGALAGALGSSLLGSLTWVSWISTLVLAAGFLAAAWQILRGGSLHVPLPAFTRRWVMEVFHGPGSPLVLGAASVLLPCGWLYTFVLGATATRSVVRGALFLALFWLGTLPALAGAQFLSSRFHSARRRAPVLAAVLLISLAFVSISARVFRDAHEHGGAHHSHGDHHEQPGTH